MYVLIGVWGYERRIYAAVKFILYTAAGSVLMLIAIIGLAWLHYSATGAYSFDLWRSTEVRRGSVLVFLAFAGVRHQGAAVPVSHSCPTRTWHDRP
jgi:NADH-quinone oxidoreductase subunit M